MGGWTKYAKKYLFNFDAIACILLAATVLFFVFSAKRKEMTFSMPTTRDFTYENGTYIAKKSKKKKPGKKKFKGEEECRRILNKMFGVSFISVRPKWLKNVATGRSLELDCYNETIRTPIGTSLAIEFDGEQHSKYIPHFHKSGPQEFIYQARKDQLKDKICKERGVLLIRVPHNVAFHDLERYLRHELNRHNVHVPY